jgi:hypothetical protein
MLKMGASYIPSMGSAQQCSVLHPGVFQENLNLENPQPNMEKGNFLPHSQAGHPLDSQESKILNTDKDICIAISRRQISKLHTHYKGYRYCSPMTRVSLHLQCWVLFKTNDVSVSTFTIYIFLRKVLQSIHNQQQCKLTIFNCLSLLLSLRNHLKPRLVKF